MSKRTVTPFRPVYPTPAAMITSVSADGKPNIITLGEVFNVSLSTPPIAGIAIRKGRYSHELISLTREFVINLPGTALLDQVELCGRISGRSVDKFAESGLTALAAERVAPPLIAECPVNLECVLLGVQEVGDHDLFLGEVVRAHADEAVLDAEGRVDYDRLDAFCFMFNLGTPGEYRTIGPRIDRAFAPSRPRAGK